MYDFYDDAEDEERDEEQESIFTDMRKLVDDLDEVEPQIDDLPDEQEDIDF